MLVYIITNLYQDILAPRGIPIKKECGSEVLKKIPKRYQDLILWASLKYSHLFIGTNSETTH